MEEGRKECFHNVNKWGKYAEKKRQEGQGVDRRTVLDRLLRKTQ